MNNDDDTVEVNVVTPELWSDIRVFLFAIAFDGKYDSSTWCRETVERATNLWRRMEEEG